MAPSSSVTFCLVFLCLVFVTVQSTPAKIKPNQSPNLNRQKRSFWPESSYSSWSGSWRLPNSVYSFLYATTAAENKSLSKKVVELQSGQKNITDILRNLTTIEARGEVQSINERLSGLERGQETIIGLLHKWLEAADKKEPCQPRHEAENLLRPVTESASPSSASVPEITPRPAPTMATDSELKFQREQQVTPVKQEATTVRTPSDDNASIDPPASTAAVSIEATTIDDELPQNNEVFV